MPKMIAFRCPAELWEVLDVQADGSRRNLSAFIVRVLREHFQAQADGALDGVEVSLYDAIARWNQGIVANAHDVPDEADPAAGGVDQGLVVAPCGDLPGRASMPTPIIRH